MNKKLSLIILFLILISLITTLLTFLAFNKGNSNENYEELNNRVSQLEDVASQLESKISAQIEERLSSQNNTGAVVENTNNDDGNQSVPTVTKTITGNEVNMRASASTSGQVIKVLTKGTTVTLTGQTASANGYQWVQVKDPTGATGWVVTTYLQ